METAWFNFEISTSKISIPFYINNIIINKKIIVVVQVRHTNFRILLENNNVASLKSNDNMQYKKRDKTIFHTSVDLRWILQVSRPPCKWKKEPCYPKSSPFCLGDYGSLQSPPEAVGVSSCWLIGELQEAFLTWWPDCIWIGSWLDQIAQRNLCTAVCPP